MGCLHIPESCTKLYTVRKVDLIKKNILLLQLIPSLVIPELLFSVIPSYGHEQYHEIFNAGFF